MNLALTNGHYVFKVAWKRCKTLKAIPRYSFDTKERRKILKFYIEAQIKNLTSKKQYQVDHIIPINHPYVCGLHVSSNLQVVTKQKNAQKGNVFTPYREHKGKKYYYKDLEEGFSYKPRKKFKKNPRKLVKKRSKQAKNKLKTVKTLLKAPPKKLKTY